MSETYTDPSRLFTIDVPGGFKRDPEARSLVFRHDDFDGAVTVSCLRHKADDAQVELFDALPSRDAMQNVERAKTHGMDIVTGDYQGELQNRPEYWRWWTLQRGPIGVVVSFNTAPEHATRAGTKVEALVDAIRITARPPTGVEDFTAMACDVYAEALGRARPEVTKPLELRGAGDTVLRLDNAYISYLQEWDENNSVEVRPILQAWFEHLWGEQNEDIGDFEEVQNLIYPIVRAWGYGRETEVELLRRTIIEDELELFAAVDTGRTLRFLRPEDVERWEGVDEDKVFFYARENLMALAEDIQLQALTGPDGEPSAVIIATQDSYDASRLMLPNLYEKLSDVVGKNLLVGVPNRDFLIILNADDEELVNNVSEQVKVDAETRPYPISPNLYRLTSEGPRPLS